MAGQPFTHRHLCTKRIGRIAAVEEAAQGALSKRQALPVAAVLPPHCDITECQQVALHLCLQQLAQRFQVLLRDELSRACWARQKAGKYLRGLECCGSHLGGVAVGLQCMPSFALPCERHCEPGAHTQARHDMFAMAL